MSAIFLKSAFSLKDIPRTNRPQIATVGRSNVGKSSLINHLTHTKGLARVGKKPGLTQSMNLYDVDERYYLIDLPGYGYARTSKKGNRDLEAMIENLLSDSELLKLVLLIIDSRHGFTKSDQHVFEQLQEMKLPFVVVFNKVDKLSNSARTLALKNIRNEHPDVTFIPHSINDTKGLGDLQAAINQTIRDN